MTISCDRAARSLASSAKHSCPKGHLAAPRHSRCDTETCRQARAWRDAGLLTGSIAVNVPAPAVQHARFPGWVAEALQASGLPAEALVIELTERSLVRNIGLAAEMLSRLGALGVRIGIDDFGVGHSALGYLNRLPVHKLKLDRSFVEGLPDDPDSATIVRNLIRMARDLMLEVIAEGFNLFNRANYQLPNATFGTGATPNATFGRPTAAADPRQIQFGLRVAF